MAFFARITLRIVRDQRNGFEIVDHVVGERVDRSVHHVRGERDAEGQRVAVGLRAGDPADTEGAVCARHVFDDDRLAERRRACGR